MRDQWPRPTSIETRLALASQALEQALADIREVITEIRTETLGEGGDSGRHDTRRRGTDPGRPDRRP